MMSAPAVTGQRRCKAGKDAVSYGRSFPLPLAELWTWLTDPELLRRWLGRWRADDEGHFFFRIGGEIPDAPEFVYEVSHCAPQQSVALVMRNPGESASWELDLELTSAGEGASHLLAHQVISNPVMAPTVGATCEYYLDRLVLAIDGQDADKLDFDDYFVAAADGYRAMFPLPRAASSS